MKTFTDTAGRTWTISLNLGTAMSVKDALGIDLLQPEAGDPPLLTRLGTDELLLGEVICCLLAGQFEAHKVMAEGHGRDEWGRMAFLCALMANCHRDPKKGRAFRVADFDPFGREPGEVIEVNRENIATLKQAFTRLR